MWVNMGQYGGMGGNAEYRGVWGRIHNGVLRTTMYVLIYNEAGSMIL